MRGERRRLIVGEDGVARCWWGASTPDYVEYHDGEWGLPVDDDHLLFEKLSLEGFQSGLSWLTILRKREAFRARFAGFDYEVVAHFDGADVARLLDDAGIVRHRGKIEATINNAGRPSMSPTSSGRSRRSSGRTSRPNRSASFRRSRRSRGQWRKS